MDNKNMKNRDFRWKLKTNKIAIQTAIYLHNNFVHFLGR